MTQANSGRRLRKSGGREFFQIDRAPGREILDFRGLNLEPVRLLGHYRYTSAHGELAAHSHGEMIEICYLESGKQIYEVNGKEFLLSGGDVFVTFPGERHGTGAHPEARGNLYWLLLSVPAARRRFLSLPRDEGRQLLRGLLNLRRRVFGGSGTMPQTLHAIFKHHALVNNPLRALHLRNLLIEFLLDVISSGNYARHAAFSPHIQSVLALIEAKIEEPMPLKGLAAQVKLSLPRFKARFKEEVGIPPADYILRRRLKRAAQLLHETDAPVTDIALRLGFSSSQYFATVFKRYTRCSPREARTSQVVIS